MADADKTFEKVRDIVVEQLGVEADEVSIDSTFIDDLGADSLDIVELIMAFEEEFNIEIPDEAAEKIKKVQDVVTYIDQTSNYSLFVLPFLKSREVKILRGIF